jgi:hypothetical protein
MDALWMGKDRLLTTVRNGPGTGLAWSVASLFRGLVSPVKI